MLLHCATVSGHKPEVETSLPVFSPHIISDDFESRFDTTEHSLLVDEYSSSDGSTEDEAVSSDCSGTCVHE